MKVTAAAKASARVPVRRAIARAARPVPSSAVARLGVQTALVVGAVNDPLEHEAVVNAERVASGGMALVAGVEAGPPARREGLGGQPSLDQLDQVPAMPENLKEPVVPPEQDVQTEDLKAEDMQEIEAGGEDGGDAGAAADPTPAGEAVQPDRNGLPAAVGPAGGAAPPGVAGRVAAPDGGRPLPADLRSTMEHRFAADFGSVRLHDRAVDRADAAQLGARAFTHGRHIWLGPGEHVSDTRLIAHELTHVVQQTGRQVAAPAGRQVARAAELPVRRAGYIAEKAEDIARNIPGYTLLSVILGKSPITGDTVPRTAENLVGGFLGLIPGGTLLFDQLKQARVIQDAFDWVNAKLAELDISWARIKKAIDGLLSWSTLRDPIGAVKSAFGPILSDIATFAVALKDKLVELVIKGALKLAGPHAERVWSIINSARDTLGLILENPLGFARNLFGAVVKGFGQFGSNILDHLKRGLLGWLFGALEGADLKLPAKLDLKGIMSIGFQLLGLTWERLRAKIVKKLDPAGETKVSFVEKAIDVIRTLVTEGFVGIWRRMLDYIDNLKQTVVEGIKDFVKTSIVKAGISWLAGLTNPVGAIIKLAMAIYDVITVFLERLQQILDVAESLFASIRTIALGNIDAAANKVEETIGRTVPVVISFIAGLLNLNGISAKIREIIRKLRAPVDKAIDRLLTFLVKKAKKLFSRLIGKLNRKRKLPAVPFRFGKRQHQFLAKRNGRKVEVLLASGAGQDKDNVEEQEKEQLKTVDDPKAKAEGTKAVALIDSAGAGPEQAAEGIDPDSQKQNALAGTQKLKTEMEAAGKVLEPEGDKLGKFPQLDTGAAAGPLLFRAKEPRFPDIEGKAGTYKQRGAETGKKITDPTTRDTFDETYSIYYENDHLPEKQFAHLILKHLDKFKPGAAGGDVVDRNTEQTAAPPTERDSARPVVGELGKSITTLAKDAPAFPAITLYRPVHKAKGATDAGKAETLVLQAASSTEAGGPLAALQAMLKKEIQSEANAIASIIKQDQTADPGVRSSVTEGLKAVAELGRAIYGLDAVPKIKSARGKPDPNKPATALSELAFTGDAKPKPDFTRTEGRYDPHGKFDEGYGRYMEYDHVIDAAWPLNTQSLTFGQPDLHARIVARTKSSGLDPEAPEVSARLADLSGKTVFSGQKIGNYKHTTGMAIALYRPIHRVVSVKVQTELGDKAAKPVAALQDAYLEPLVRYVRSGDDKDLADARSKVQTELHGKFDKAVASHAGFIKAEYKKEERNAEAINPDHKDQAKTAIGTIVKRVDDNLGKADTETDALFKP